MPYTITVLPGEGIGPEITSATLPVLEATGVKFVWDIMPDVGQRSFEACGDPLPASVIAAMKQSRATIKGPINTPLDGLYPSVNVRIRKELDLYACVRPVCVLPGVPPRIPGPTDLVIIRENTEDLYAGIEAPADGVAAREIVDVLTEYGLARSLPVSPAFSIKMTSDAGSLRIARYAFVFAKMQRRKKVTCVTKATIMPATDGLFLEAFNRVARDFPDIATEHLLVDVAAKEFIRAPSRYDVILCPNLYGDILSDLAAEVVGGLGLAPGANIGDNHAVFEATHGTAPDIVGQNKANPTALLLSAAMMLDYLGEVAAAKRLRAAVLEVLREGTHVTADLNPTSPVSTQEMAHAVREKLLASGGEP